MTRLSLDDRAIVRIAGPDAEKLLQDVVTSDIAALASDDAAPAALLTPQGKILFEFLVSRAGDGFLIDIGREMAADFVRRMTLYKLRAKAEIALDDTLSAIATWDEAPAAGSRLDRRFRESDPVYRLYPAKTDADNGERTAYDLLRIRGGVAECGHDFETSDVFPHDVLLDRNGGVSFAKGCFVGQEVVSRMQHRGTARRRLAIAMSESPLPAPGTPILAGGKPAGTLGTVVDREGLAIVRIDRVGAALAAGEPVAAADISLTLRLPDWSGLDFPAAMEDS